jgi:very-short-patch-repair endonuclease
MSAERHKPLAPENLERARGLRRNQTPMERKLWARLRDGRLNSIKFRRQHLIGPYIVDFYCDAVRLVIEIDGDSHVRQVEFDAERTRWLRENGFEVVRFANRDVVRNVDTVLEAIRDACRSRTPSPDPVRPWRTGSTSPGGRGYCSPSLFGRRS